MIYAKNTLTVKKPREGWERKARSTDASAVTRTCSGQPDPQGHAQTNYPKLIRNQFKSGLKRIGQFNERFGG